MDRNSGKILLDSLNKGAVFGTEQISFGQFLEDFFHPLLKEQIYKLYYEHEGGRLSRDFDRDLELHKKIVRFFNEIGYGNFSMYDLGCFDSLENRVQRGAVLNRLRGERDELNKFKRMIESHVDNLRPLIDLGIAKSHAPEIEKEIDRKSNVYESDVTSLVRISDYASVKDIHVNYVKALAIAQILIPSKLSEINTRIMSFSDLRELSHSESVGLENFKKDKDQKYSSVPYSVRYCEWRLSQLKDFSIRVDHHHYHH